MVPLDKLLNVHLSQVHSFPLPEVELRAVEVDATYLSDPQELHNTNDRGFLEAQTWHIQL